MRLVLLRSRDAIIEENNSTSDFWRNMAGRRNRI